MKTSSIMDLAAMVLIGSGGGIISYATFAANVSKQVADVGLGALLSGLFVLIVVNVYRLAKR